MAYYVTPDLGLELADPLTIQPFETTNVNSNFELLEAGIVADRVRLTLVEGRASTLETDVETLQDRVTARPADLTALAALPTGELLAGDSAYVAEGAVVMRWSGSAWVQSSLAVFASTAARDTAYAKASAAYRVANVHCLTSDTGSEWVYTGTQWIARGASMSRQLDTTNDVEHFSIQHGVGKIIGNGTATIAETVTFPTAFAVVPTVIVTTAGGRATGSFNMTSLSSASSAVASQALVTTTNFEVTLRAFTGTLSAATDWYYTWIAIGVAA